MSEKMTRKAALEFVMALPEVAENIEVSEVLSKMYASVTRPRVKSDAPSKTQIENARLADECVVAIESHGEPVTTKWITEHIKGIMTPQKASAVMGIAIADGRIVRNKEGKKVTYSIAE